MKLGLIHGEECYKIVGACFAVYKTMGCGFLEGVYQECLEIEFNKLAIPCKPQPLIDIKYGGQTLKQTYQPDFVCFDKIIVELKAVSRLVDEHRAQIINYLNATGFELGLLVNFGHFPKLEYERLIFQSKRAIISRNSRFLAGKNGK